MLLSEVIADRRGRGARTHANPDLKTKTPSVFHVEDRGRVGSTGDAARESGALMSHHFRGLACASFGAAKVPTINNATSLFPGASAVASVGKSER